MSIAIIAAMARNGVMGNSKLGGKLPWVIPEELRFFRKETMGKVIVMGRKTAESIGCALDGRRCIVLSTQHGYQLDGFETMRYSEIMCLSASSQIMVCGGAEIYSLFMDVASEVIISELDLEINGDIYMPKLPRAFKKSGVEHFNRFTVVRRVRCD